MIALIVLVPIIVYGGLPFIVVAYILATVALFELTRMYNPNKRLIYLGMSTFFLWLLMYPKEEMTIFQTTISSFDIVIVFVVLLLTITVLSKNIFTFDQAGFLLLATLYVGTAFYFLIIVRQAGLNYFLFILFIIWATDSGAYFIGKAFGQKKLWPDISPNKTIGGALGGIVMALIVGISFQLVYPFDKSMGMIIAITVIISIFGQIGDLVASAIKRHYEVKDSGKFFPGHGGILDRLDSLLFVLIILHILQFT